jgi:hypothetical protein
MLTSSQRMLVKKFEKHSSKFIDKNPITNEIPEI